LSLIVPFILAGGTGARLWPLSRAAHPKQFHNLITSDPLLIDTARRLPQSVGVAAPFVICNEKTRFAVSAAFKAASLPFQSIVLEPEGRSTAPAAAIAALLTQKTHGDAALVLLMPSDHLIQSQADFAAAAETGARAARIGHLVTFGVNPRRPDTGYGYIKVADAATEGAYTVARFTEKPDEATAAAFIAEGGYYWNSGIFLFSAATLLAELRAFEPDMLARCEAALGEAEHDLSFLRLGSSFLRCRADSIDYAIMEKTSRAAVVPFDAGWSDVGTWDALYDAGEKDAAGNVTRGDVIASSASGCYLRAENRMIAAVGIEDMIVVATKDAVLVSKRSQSGDVKKIVDQLATSRRNEAEQHLTVHRPWGSYETLHHSDRYQVKQIVVEPGASLSLQRHHHRAEHWIVVKGTARVTVNDDVRLLTENESIYVPLGAIHRLENPGLIPLTLIEVQSGSYLGEDDIVRLEDVYARK
jgi:mannose-1-phosphate guanylyltransferase/mannose-6-phosphate isomerase